MKSPFLEFLKNPFGFLAEREEKRRRNASWHEAYELERKGKFREAAAVCRKRAETYRTTNELIFAGDINDAGEITGGAFSGGVNVAFTAVPQQ